MEDIDIARKAKLKNINDIIKDYSIPEEYIENYGKYKAKISLKYLDSLKKKKDGKLILVTSINPTPLGEGKTTSAIGLSDALNIVLKDTKKKSVLALREPSMGPVFGIKGGATGGGHSQVAPMEDINLHFTGDLHALTSANNLLAALIDNHIFQGNQLGFKKVIFKRCLDMNDRQLRTITVGQSKERGMVEREDHFDITVATELMAILCLSTSLEDLKRRIGNIVVGYDEKDKPITCNDLNASGALTVILKDALNPNVVQTLENNLAVIHGGPFANIAHGCNSIVATKLALKLGDYVVTEAGFGADLGAEKFLDIKCRKFGLVPNCVVIVATIRALKYHGGALKDKVNERNDEALTKGLRNLLKHINNIKGFGINPVIAINKFTSDTKADIDILEEFLVKENVLFSLCDHWSKGGTGSIDLANKVIEIVDNKKAAKLNFTYSDDESVKTKIEKVCKSIYGASGTEYTEQAKEDLKYITKLNKQLKNIDISKFPICIAKTQYSLSDDPKNLLCDKPFKIHIESIEAKCGAEFIVVKTGKIMTMPGLPKVPAAEKITLDKDNNIVGIF